MRGLRRAPGAVVGVAGFAAFALLLTALVAGTLGRGGGDRASYTAMFTDASGLRPGDDVRIAGVRVGRVERRELDGDLARVTFSLDAAQRVYAGTRAQISYLNLLGQRYLALRDRPGGHGPALPPGATIPVDRTSAALDLTALFNAFRPLFDLLRPADVNRLAREVVAVLQGEGPTVTHLVRQTARLTRHLAGRDALIERVLANMTVVMETTAGHRAEIADLVDRLGGLVHGLARDRRQIGASLTSMQELTDATAGLVRRGRAPLTADVARVRRLAGILDRRRGRLDQALKGTPVMLEAYARAMSYGTWLNIYVCSVGLTLSGRGPALSADGGGHSEVCR